ncbi:MAG: cupin domain-containing protein [Candidatus Omnitrophica bacterium]|nr:cupin domain-containing protein [Candidatus Omnitrophota bacterium]
MKLHEKIRYLRENVAKLSLKEFHEALTDIFGDKAITYYSLCRLEKGHRAEIRLKSLYQICTGLGISLKDLKEGTEEEESKIVRIISAAERHNNVYIHNENAVSEILSPRTLKFLAMELILLPGGVTRKEEDPLEENKFEKLVIVLQGKIACHVGTELHTIKKGDALSFVSSIPHYFANPSKKLKARAIIVQNPKSY